MGQTADAAGNSATISRNAWTRWEDGALQAFRTAGQAYYRFPEAKGTIGFITALSDHFCVSCNRLRLTADGKLRPCLMSEMMIDLREPLRSGISMDNVKDLIKEAVAAKPREHHLTEGQKPNDRPLCQVGG
jgi:cyclic pyranopterin phosphate synthase